MKTESVVNCNNKNNVQRYRSFGIFLAERAYSVIIVAALFCTLAVKLFHANRYNLLDEYVSWILPDVSFLLFLEVVLAIHDGKEGVR